MQTGDREEFNAEALIAGNWITIANFVKGKVGDGASERRVEGNETPCFVTALNSGELRLARGLPFPATSHTTMNSGDN